jgi:hypothetical protein
MPHALAEASGKLKCLGGSRYWLLETRIPNALRSQTDERQATEVAIAVDVLNRMLELGWPRYVRVA